MILLVEDEEDLAKALQRYLSRAGYQCESVADGTLAMARLARAPVPKLILLDYRLPGANGLDVLQHIRSSPPTADVPVVMMSGELRRCPSAALALLEKPFDPSLLLALVQRVFAP